MPLPPKILLVEDVPSDAELSMREARKALPNSEFLVVETAEEFRAAIISFQPDLILSDFKLPLFDGLAALKIAVDMAPDIPFIIVTGSMNEDTAVECMKAGAWDYVIKEHIKRLGPAIESVLEQRKLRIEKKVMHERAKRWERVFEHAKFGLAYADARTNCFLDANTTFAHERGYTVEELRGKSVLLVYPPDTHADLRRRFKEIDRLGHVEFESLHVRKDGSMFPVRVEAISIPDEHGVPSSRVSYVLDITDRKKAEVERERLLTAIEQAAEAIIITDADGHIQYTNPAFENLTGYHLDEVLGRTPAILKSGKQDDVFYRNLWETIKDGRVWRSRITNKRKDGGEFIEEATISPVRDESGRIAHYVAVKRDITREIHTQQQLLQAQKMETVGKLAGGIAHDFNNLLTIINGYSQLLLDRLGDNDSIRADVEAILQSGLRASALTGQLLSFSRKQVLQSALLDFNRLIEELKPLLIRLVSEDIELRFDLSPTPCTVYADASLMEQVILNLVVNSRDAMPHGGSITIQTRASILPDSTGDPTASALEGRYLQMSVSDTGSGMNEETRLRVFEPFFTTKAEGKGTGLGLPTAQGIVLQSGGQVTVESQVGRGTTFTVYLPLRDEPAEEPERIEQMFALQGRETILLAEDLAPLRELVENVLHAHGYKVLSAANAEEALAFAEAEDIHIDLLLTDLVMPGMNGLELARRIAATHPGLKTLYMTGYGIDVVTAYGISSSSLNLIQKPFTPQQLTHQVRSTLGPPAPLATILVVDGEPGVRGFLRAALEPAGYRVIEAADGQQALGCARTSIPQLVIADLAVAEHYGADLVDALRSEIPSIRIIAISGAFSHEHLKMVSAVRADAVMGKPISPELLLARIRNLLHPKA